MKNCLIFISLGLFMLMSCTDKKAVKNEADAISTEEKTEIIKLENLTKEIDEATDGMENVAKELDAILEEIDK